MISVRRRARVAVVTLFWAIRFEIVIRRRSLPVLAAMAGLRCDFSPTAALTAGRPTNGGLQVSHQDLFALHLVASLYRLWPHKGTCLRECLVAGRLLRYRAPVLRVGVHAGVNRIEAHAWLEFDGIAIDPTAGDFTLLMAP